MFAKDSEEFTNLLAWFMLCLLKFTGDYEFVSLVYAMFAKDSEEFTNSLAWFMLCLLNIHRRLRIC